MSLPDVMQVLACLLACLVCVFSPKVFSLDGFKNLMDAKVLIINKLIQIKSIGTFLETENGLRATNPEGFVAIRDGAALKLVDRLEFSRANFTVAKDWTK